MSTYGSNQPSTLRETENEYQLSGRIIINGDGKSLLAYATGELMAQVDRLGPIVGSHRRRFLHSSREPGELSEQDDNKIIVIIIIIIIIIIIGSCRWVHRYR